MKIDSVIVLCWKGDFRLARICLASIRYFYPDIPLYLMKNIATGDFDTSEVERALNVSTKGLENRMGKGWGKLEMLFRPELGRFLFIDADQIMVGPVIDELEKCNAQFVVVPDALDPDSDTVDRLYYNRARLTEFDPAYQMPRNYFNSGQYVATAGVLAREDFDRIVEWGPPLKVRDSRIFNFLDQSILNYVFQKSAREGKLTLDWRAFMHLARTDYFWNVKLDTIKTKEAHPLLFHWAGQPKNFISLMRRGDLLGFFEQYYYSQVKYGIVIQFVRTLATTPKNTYQFAYSTAGSFKKVCRRLLASSANKSSMGSLRNSNTHTSEPSRKST
jgi:lipopolysaccharide biosynthesis glycosyltransferase